jgi:hypothetical protein
MKCFLVNPWQSLTKFGYKNGSPPVIWINYINPVLSKNLTISSQDNFPVAGNSTLE